MKVLYSLTVVVLATSLSTLPILGQSADNLDYTSSEIEKVKEFESAVAADKAAAFPSTTKNLLLELQNITQLLKAVHKEQKDASEKILELLDKKLSEIKRPPYTWVHPGKGQPHTCGTTTTCAEDAEKLCKKLTYNRVYVFFPQTGKFNGRFEEYLATVTCID